MELSIRVALKHHSIDDVLPSLGLDTCRHYLWALEGASTDNPHVHVYLDTEIAQATLRARFRKLGLCGNGGYSMSVVKDKLKALAYFMKGGDYHTNLPDDVLQAAKQEDARVKSELKVKVDKKKNVMDSIIALIPDDADTSAVARLIVQYHVDHGLPIRRFHLKMLYDTILCRLPQWSLLHKESLARDLFVERER